MISLLSELPKEAVKTTTYDQGEFVCGRKIGKTLQCDMYFADPYRAWQKGTNENLNGLLREFYPKGRNLSRVSPATLKKEPDAYKRQAQKSFAFQNTAGFLPGKSYQVSHSV